MTRGDERSYRSQSIGTNWFFGREEVDDKGVLLCLNVNFEFRDIDGDTITHTFKYYTNDFQNFNDWFEKIRDIALTDETRDSLKYHAKRSGPVMSEYLDIINNDCMLAPAA